MSLAPGTPAGADFSIRKSPPASTAPVDLYGLAFAEVENWVVRQGFKAVHAAGLWSCLYRDLAESFEAMSALPAKLRARLPDFFSLTRPEVALDTRSSDGFTRKYLLRFADGQTIEAVEMKFTGRYTACISSQAGCAMGCVFCATGQMGFSRQLTAGEIVAQVVHVQRALKSKSPNSQASNLDSETQNPEPGTGAALRNLVLMGMGEPLHNYDAVMAAVDILCDPRGFSFGGRRITLSTVGLVPGIRRLADEARPVHLAVSLHGATDADRAALVPVARRWPLAELMDACRYYGTKLSRRIFYEWTLIEGVNDSADQAHAVGRLLHGQDAQVNLIPLNPTIGFDGRPGRSASAKNFQQILAKYGLPSTVRQRRGLDIAAGCGQLRTTASG